jgi:glycosyltransferase involved in cell wall biosynthesis
MSTRLLHVLPGFGLGGIQTHLAMVANALGNAFHHMILPLDGNDAARSRLDAATSCEILAPFVGARAPLRHLGATLGCLRRARPALVVTYNWGCVDWCLANRWFGRAPGLHCEHGFGREEAGRRLRRRDLFRRFALGGAIDLVVPSQSLAAVAREAWRIPSPRLHLITNGIDAAALRDRAALAAPRVTRPPGGILIGAAAPLRPEKDLAVLLRAFALAAGGDPSWRLAIVGDGAERAALAALAGELGVAAHVDFVGALADPAPTLAAFDIYALSSRTEQMPYGVLEAMALGLPVVGTDVGDVAVMLAPENRSLLVPAGDVPALAVALRRAATDRGMRARLGTANAARSVETFGAGAMCASYRALWSRLAAMR